MYSILERTDQEKGAVRMSTKVISPAVVYPDSDGKPMAENTLQFEWITTIVGGLRAIYRHDPNVFVAGDLLWYPVEGNNKLRSAPDAMVIFGRPKGYRGSYIQFREEGIAPQVVFEVLSPGNRVGEMGRKRAFYERYGVEEYYLIDPKDPEVEGKAPKGEEQVPDVKGWRREGGKLRPIQEIYHWVSPRLGIRFERGETELRIFGPDGRRFQTYEEIAERAEDLEQRAEDLEQRAVEERDRAEQEHNRAEQEHNRAETERLRAERLAEMLRSLGADPDA